MLLKISKLSRASLFVTRAAFQPREQEKPKPQSPPTRTAQQDAAGEGGELHLVNHSQL